MQTRLGGPEETRTLDLSDANRTLSQLSYRPIRVIYVNLLPTIVATSPVLRDGNLPACSPRQATEPPALHRDIISLLHYKVKSKMSVLYTFFDEAIQRTLRKL